MTYPSPFTYSVADTEAMVRLDPSLAQSLLLAEYKQHRPRYALIQWLKRHRVHNPTVRTIHKP